MQHHLLNNRCKEFKLSQQYFTSIQTKAHFRGFGGGLGLTTAKLTTDISDIHRLINFHLIPSERPNYWEIQNTATFDKQF